MNRVKPIRPKTLQVIVTRAFWGGGMLHNVGDALELPYLIAVELEGGNKVRRADPELDTVAPPEAVAVDVEKSPLIAAQPVRERARR